MLEAKNIEKSFGSLKVLTDLSLTIAQGSITILAGPSGSGKSTLIRCLSLLDYPCKGKIILDGFEYSFPKKKQIQEASIYPKISCVFQQLYLWPHLTNRKNILLPLINTTYDTNELNRYIDLFGMKEFIDKYPNESSLGQKQRVSLVRSLILKPEYLLLDEVTSALDSDNTKAVLSELSSLSSGILLISHDHRILSSECYTPVFLENGEIKNRVYIT